MSDWYRRNPHYRRWDSMVRRCHDPKHPSYAYYGGRGIRVHPDWVPKKTGYRLFASYLNSLDGWEAGATVDRIDNSLGYVPGNLRWASRKTQMRNTRRNTQYEMGKTTKSLGEWCDDYGHDSYQGYTMVWKRLQRGWGLKRALTTPSQRSKG